MSSIGSIDVELLEEFEDDSDAESSHTNLKQAILNVNEMQWTKQAEAAEKQMHTSRFGRIRPQ